MNEEIVDRVLEDEDARAEEHADGVAKRVLRLGLGVALYVAFAVPAFVVVGGAVQVALDGTFGSGMIAGAAAFLVVTHTAEVYGEAAAEAVDRVADRIVGVFNQ
ncbi:hypothetical protein [Halobaculum rubrum]|uniref:hypothetical protein n=1 Tax=Halobaculum rubrum TaxID=2872158 RepID=UPI001CA45BA9|nr:hypothetical protein [Halobaculum rubrum]QZX98737.1 hypothetical protein K6T25_10675 [Halobaculum rubrum]